MYNNEWEDVLALTNNIIDSGKFELYNDFYELFKIPGKLCNESLLEYQFTDFGTGSGDIVQSDNWFSFQGPRGRHLSRAGLLWSQLRKYKIYLQNVVRPYVRKQLS